MKLVGLTGGIGSGKSTVSDLLAAHGAVVIDADAVVRQVQQPGSPALAKMAERFGAKVIAADGSLDRGAVAAAVFSDPQALSDLNAIVHPAVRREMDRRVAAYAATDRVVVLDIPLLTEHPREGLQGIIVVDVPEELQVRRLVEHRGFSEADARSRIVAQASRADRLATASVVVDNSGSRDDLAAQIDAVWRWVEQLPELGQTPPMTSS